MTVTETSRLRLREFVETDAPFVFELVNQPSWIANIGDRGVRTQDDARAYITDRLRASYASDGFGFWCVELRETSVPIGLCGLVKRPQLDAPDIGYALLPEFWQPGVCPRGCRRHRHWWPARSYGIHRLVAIVNPTNAPSIRLLEHLGMALESSQRMPGESEDVSVYGMALKQS